MAVANKHIPAPHFTREGQYLLDNHQRQFGAMLNFLDLLAGRIERGEEVASAAGEIRAMVRTIKQTTYRVLVEFSEDGGDNVDSRVEEVTYFEPVGRMQDVFDDACNRVLERLVAELPDGQLLPDSHEFIDCTLLEVR